MDKEIKAQQSSVICPELYNEHLVALGFKYEFVQLQNLSLLQIAAYPRCLTMAIVLA